MSSANRMNVFPFRSMLNRKVSDISNGAIASTVGWESGRANVVVEWMIVAMLSCIPFIIYFSSRLKSMYDYAAFGLLLLWMTVLRKRPARSIPKYVIIAVGFYLFSFLISVLISDQGERYPPSVNSIRIPVLAGLLFAAPLRSEHRKFVLAVFLVCAGAAGTAGILQYFGVPLIASTVAGRSSGFSIHPITYAAILAFACGASVLLLLAKGDGPFRSRPERLFLLTVILLTTLGILFSQSRGVWIAFIAALVLTLFLYEPKKGLASAVVIVVTLAVVFTVSPGLRHRFVSIGMSFFTEDVRGSTGNRLELWKGSMLIFQQAPLFGTGIWDFDTDIHRLIVAKKLRNMPFTCHGHNLFFHTLATQGAVGMLALTGLLASLTWWSVQRARAPGGIGGYVMLMSTVIIIVGGLTEISLAGGSSYSFAYWFIMGLTGPYARETGTAVGLAARDHVP